MLRVSLRQTYAALCVAGIACLSVPAVCRAQATSYTISTVAGTGTSGFAGDLGNATSAKLNLPIQVALDSSHNYYIADSTNARVRKVSNGKISTFAGIGLMGYTGDGGPATSAAIYDPYGVWVDATGNVFIADLDINVVRKVGTDGKIASVAGNPTSQSAQFGGDGGPATSASLYQPLGLVTDSAGNLYFTDSGNHRIRMVTPDGNINTYVGNGNPGFSGDGGQATNAQLWAPFGLAMDSAGNLYFADSRNNRIRKVTPKGIISTVVGVGTAGSGGDGGPALSAQLSRPWDVKVDAAGDLFIADYSNSRIRMVTPDGIINTIAGGSGPGYTGDGGAATSAKLNFPTGLAVDTNGNIYIADSSNNVIRLLTPTAPTAGGVTSASDFGAFSAVAPGSWIQIYGSNLSTDRRSWASGDFSGVNAPTTLDGTTVTIGGQSAFVDFISGGQVNAQVPSNVSTGSQQLIVKNANGSSAAYNVTVNTTQPGLLAPASFKIGGTQYVTALFSDLTTYVLPPGSIAGVTSQRAKAGDTIVFYGVGFGPVNPNIPAGQIVQQNNALVVAPQISIGAAQTTLTFAGLAQGYVGLYQFNVVVPNITPGDKVPVTFTLGGTAGAQTLYIATQ